MADKKVRPQISDAIIGIVNRLKGGRAERRSARDGDVGRLGRSRRRESGKHCAEDEVFNFHFDLISGFVGWWLVVLKESIGMY
jgi:hypothetical protein